MPSNRALPIMERIKALFLLALVLAGIAFALGHYMNNQGIRSQADAVITAQEKIENRELAVGSR
jgi:CHASE3 domain sensor protein